jgi:hypothetical protein
MVTYKIDSPALFVEGVNVANELACILIIGTPFRGYTLL